MSKEKDIFGDGPNDIRCLIRTTGKAPWPPENFFPIIAWSPMPESLMKMYAWNPTSV